MVSDDLFQQPGQVDSALLNAGSSIPARMAMIAITTSNSINVKARRNFGAAENQKKDECVLINLGRFNIEYGALARKSLRISGISRRFKVRNRNQELFGKRRSKGDLGRRTRYFVCAALTISSTSSSGFH